MLKEITVPSPGESVTEVTLASWLKADGDFVKKDEELFEIESDKATLSVYADADGKLEIRLAEGETVRVGTVAGVIDTSVTAPTVTPPAAAVSKEDGAYTVGLASVAAQKLMEERGIPATQLQGSGRGGRITKADVLAYSSEETPLRPPDEAGGDPSPSPVQWGKLEGGRRESEARFWTPAQSPKTRGVQNDTQKEEAPLTSPRERGERSREVRRHKLSALRLKLAERLVAVKNQTAMLTTFNEVDMSPIIDLRAKYKEKFKETHSVGLGLMSFFVKACCQALSEYPAVNAAIEGDEIVYHDYVDMGIAVSTTRGLVVPVIRNAESLPFDQIEMEMERLATRARSNQLTLDEMSGGTFTISNGGVFGSLLSTPILNPPQSGILGMHNIVKRPIAVGDQIEIRPMMYLAFSYDHRLIDGRESVSFLVRVKELVEDPMRLLLRV